MHDYDGGVLSNKSIWYSQVLSTTSALINTKILKFDIMVILSNIKQQINKMD